LKRAAATLAVLAFVAAGLAALAGVPLVQARRAWLGGHYAEALANAQSGARYRLWDGEYRQVTAASALLLRRRDAATSALAGGKALFDVLPEPEVARRLFAIRDYDGFLAYDAAFGGAAALAAQRAAANVLTHHLDQASAAMAAVPASDPHRAALQHAIDVRQSGHVPLVFDRDGRAFAELRGSELTATDADFAPLVDAKAGALTIGSQLPRLGADDTLETTLDPFVQHAAVEALGAHRGALVAIDPRTNEILAIASTRGSGPETDIALESQYEPGSVIKVLTSLNAVGGGTDVKAMLPYECKGDLMIDGRHFGDWMAQGHGELHSLNDALAVSCNIFYADVGLRLGRERLQSFMTSAGFDGTTSLGYADVPLGKFVGRVFNRYETAFMAIGLEHESINTLHLAMLASMMANRGVLTPPRLLRSRHSILGEATYSAAAPAPKRLASAAAAEEVIDAMQAVADSPKGTGRRAPVAGIPMAMKTGTAGKRPGLEALIMAFAPVDAPKIAFAVIGEDAGPAEFAGAEIAHKFIEKMKPRL